MLVHRKNYKNHSWEIISLLEPTRMSQNSKKAFRFCRTLMRLEIKQNRESGGSDLVLKPWSLKTECRESWQTSDALSGRMPENVILFGLKTLKLQASEDWQVPHQLWKWMKSKWMNNETKMLIIKVDAVTLICKSQL